MPYQFHSKQKLDPKEALLDQRKRLIHPDRTMLTSRPLVRDTSNWVKTWVDPGHMVQCDVNRVTAYRAVTDTGQLLWMVRHPNKRFGYHATHQDPAKAIEQAVTAWMIRRAIGKRWNEVRTLRRQILTGRCSLVACRQDAYDAGLCRPGVAGFMQALGQGKKDQMGGRMLALASFIDKQAAYVLFTAHLRVAAGCRVDIRGAITS